MKPNLGYTKFKDCHRGSPGIVIANGPGLAEIPIDFLNKYPSHGCNRITLMAPEFAPNYYYCLGRNQIDTAEKRETFIPTLVHKNCKAAFLNRLYAHLFPFDEIYSIMGGSFYGFGQSPDAPSTRFFSYDPLHITGLGATMVFVMLQIAYYMGHDPVLIVGLDHHYPDSTKKHFYDDSDVPNFESAPGPVYENDTSVWRQHADFMFRLARKHYDDGGREIINLSVQTACEIFRKEALSSWL